MSDISHLNESDLSIMKIALVLEEWAPVDENAIYAEEDAAGELTTAATDETSILDGNVDVDSSVDGIVDEDTNEGVDGAKAAEAMAVALAPLEGGYIALEGDMTQPLPG